MRFLSLFSGIEAASVAWLPLGWTCGAVAEIDPFCCDLLRHHYPTTQNLGDVTAPGFLERVRAIGPWDVVVGGSPCQAFSVAGRRLGLNDDRGNLTLRYLEVVDESRAALAVWENVPGVLSDRTNAFGCLLGGLAGADCPLDPPGGRWSDAGVVLGPARSVAWRVFDAQYFGLAQRRRRVFVVADSSRTERVVKVLLELDILRRDTAPRREEGEGVARALTSSLGGAGGKEQQHTFIRGDGEPLNPLGFHAKQDPISSDDMSPCLGGTPGSLGVAFGGNRISPTLRAEGYDASEDGSGRRALVGGVRGVRRLTPTECERLQGFPDGYTLIPRGRNGKLAADGPRYRALGNSMAVPVMAWIGRRIAEVWR